MLGKIVPVLFKSGGGTHSFCHDRDIITDDLLIVLLGLQEITQSRYELGQNSINQYFLF